MRSESLIHGAAGLTGSQSIPIDPRCGVLRSSLRIEGKAGLWRQVREDKSSPWAEYGQPRKWLLVSKQTKDCSG